MALSIAVLKDMLDSRFPAGAIIGRVMFLINPSTKLSIPLATGDINAATLTVNDKIPAPGVNEPNRNFAVGTRFRFTSISGIVSTPQVVTNRIYHVIEVTIDDISISETPLDLVANAITFTPDTGTGTIEELNISESITTNVGTNTLTELTEVYTVADAARFEVFLGAAVDRPEWTPNAFTFDRPRTPGANTLTAIMPRAKVGELIAGQEEAYSGFALLIGGNATVFDTAAGTIAFIEVNEGGDPLQASVTSTILGELFLRPSNVS